MVDWDAGLEGLSVLHPELAEWAAAALGFVSDELAALGASDLPFTVIHGDFMAEQNVHFVSELGDRVYVLEKGMVRYQGTMAQFVGNDEVRRAYLAV